MKKNNIIGGLVLILLAVFILGSGLGYVPDIPWFKLCCTVIFAAAAIKGLIKLDFYSSILSLCCLGWMYDDVLGIEEITPFPLFLAGILLAIGLSMIFKKHKLIRFHYQDGNTWREGTIDDVRKEEWQDGRNVTLQNIFNSTSKYVNSAAFSSASLENHFGTANVYFTNATIYNGEATVNLENNFGQMNIYFPNTWRANISQESAFGHVRVLGEPNRDMDAPLVIVNAESNFGNLNIIFD